MLPFRPIDGDSILTLKRFLAKETFRTCDYTIGAVYQWRKHFRSEVAIENDMLFMRSVYKEQAPGYLFPLGFSSIETALDAVELDARERGIPLVFCAVPEECLPILKNRFGEGVTVEERREWAEYLYDCDALIRFSGKAYHTQKNHRNRFYKEHPDAHLVAVNEETLETACAFLSDYAANTPPDSEVAAEEMKGAYDLLQNALRLDQKAAYLETDGTVAALSIGETQGDTLYVHVEKARRDFAGAYQAIVSAFADYARTESTRIINREDDSGDEGLRYSKLAYRPIALASKYWVTVHP